MKFKYSTTNCGTEQNLIHTDFDILPFSENKGNKSLFLGVE